MRTAEAGGSIRLAQIVGLVFNSPLIQVVSLGRTLGVTYSTAKADIDRLVQVGILKELPGVSPKTYFAPQIFMVAYDQLLRGKGWRILGVSCDPKRILFVPYRQTLVGPKWWSSTGFYWFTGKIQKHGPSGSTCFPLALRATPVGRP